MAKKAKRSPAAAPVTPPTPSVAAPSLESRVLGMSPWQMALAALGVHLGLMALVFNPTIFTGGDNGVYVALARALAEQGRYISLHDPSLSPHTYYPPGYPIILALASLVGIHPWVPLKLLTVAFSGLGVAFSCLWMRRRASAGVALFCAVIVAFSPGLLTQGHIELSDVPFWGLCMVALWALEGLPRDSRRRIALAGIMTAAAYLTRSAALPLVVAVFAWLTWERRWRQAAVFAAIVIPTMLLWAWWKSSNGAADLTYGEYANTFWLKDHYDPDLGRASLVDVFVVRPLLNAERYAGVMVPLLLTARGGGSLLVLGAGLCALALVGWARRLRAPGLAEFFFPLYGGMLAVLPVVWAGERYLFPIFPLALAYACEAAAWLGARWGAAVPRFAAAAFLLLLFALAAQPMVGMVRVGSFCRQAYLAGERYACLPPEWQDYLGMADWVRDTLPADAVIISRKPGLFFALSDRRGIDIPKTADPEAYFATAEKAGAQYVVLDRTDDLTALYTIPPVTSFPRSFCIAHTGAIEGTAILGIFYDIPRDQPAGPTDEVVFRECRLPVSTSARAPGAAPGQ